MSAEPNTDADLDQIVDGLPVLAQLDGWVQIERTPWTRTAPRRQGLHLHPGQQRGGAHALNEAISSRRPRKRQTLRRPGAPRWSTALQFVNPLRVGELAPA